MRRWFMLCAICVGTAAAVPADSFEPSPLAREIALSAIGPRSETESEEAHLRRAYEASLQVERSLRFGLTGQEARARLRQRLRLLAAAGEEAGERVAAKMKEVERRKDPAQRDRGAKEAPTSSGKGQRGK
jgi:hypothetical protein